jgi:hypothetical protein
MGLNLFYANVNNLIKPLNQKISYNLFIVHTFYFLHDKYRTIYIEI